MHTLPLGTGHMEKACGCKLDLGVSETGNIGKGLTVVNGEGALVASGIIGVELRVGPVAGISRELDDRMTFEP